jgi:hypothetical protein
VPAQAAKQFPGKPPTPGSMVSTEPASGSP